MTERYLFPLGESLACIRDNVTSEQLQTINCSPADVLQSALEEFGIEFNAPYCLTIDQILVSAGVDPAMSFHVDSEVMRLLRRILPWTEGGRRTKPGEARLIGYIEAETLVVMQLDPEPVVEHALTERDLNDAWIGQDWYPERYRRISSFYR